MRSQPARSDPYGPGDDSDEMVYLVTGAHLAVVFGALQIWNQAAPGTPIDSVSALIFIIAFINGSGWTSEAIARLANWFHTRGYHVR